MRRTGWPACRLGDAWSGQTSRASACCSRWPALCQPDAVTEGTNLRKRTGCAGVCDVAALVGRAGFSACSAATSMRPGSSAVAQTLVGGHQLGQEHGAVLVHPRGALGGGDRHRALEHHLRQSRGRLNSHSHGAAAARRAGGLGTLQYHQGNTRLRIILPCGVRRQACAAAGAALGRAATLVGTGHRYGSAPGSARLRARRGSHPIGSQAPSSSAAARVSRCDL